MNERITVWLALPGAEVGADLALWFFQPGMLQFATNRVLLFAQHAATVLAGWALISCAVWVFLPFMWRIRQETRSKLRFLSLVCLVMLVLENGVTAGLLSSVDAGLTGGVSAQEMGMVLLIRTGGALAGFWLCVWLHSRVASRRVIQVTPNPKFGRN